MGAQMAIIVMTWENPADSTKARGANERAKEWRATVLRQPGIVEYSAFVNRIGARDMAVDSFATVGDAAAFLGSQDFTDIVTEMKAFGVTNIDTQLLERHADVPEALRSAQR